MRRRPVVVPLSATGYPRSWLLVAEPGAPVPNGPGAIEAHVDVPRLGEYELWLGGSVRSEVAILIDGGPVGSVRHPLNNRGHYARLGATRLERGRHRIEIRFAGPHLHPGSGGVGASIWPLTLSSSDAAGTRLQRVAARQAEQLCGHRFDWIETARG